MTRRADNACYLHVPLERPDHQHGRLAADRPAGLSPLPRWRIGGGGAARNGDADRGMPGRCMVGDGGKHGRQRVRGKQVINLAVGFLLLYVQLACADITSNLVGWWKFDEGSGTTAIDSGSSGSNGTLTNGPTYTTGKIGPYALSFASASTQYVDISTAIHPSALTYAAWVNATTLPNAYNTIISRSNVNHYSQFFVKSNGKVAVYLTNSPSGSTNYDGSGSHTITTGTWFHIAFTYDSTSGLIGYVNGASDATASNSNAANADAISTHIADDPGSSGRNWDGLLDDVRIYSRALSSGDIAELYAYTGVNAVKHRAIQSHHFPTLRPWLTAQVQRWLLPYLAYAGGQR